MSFKQISFVVFLCACLFAEPSAFESQSGATKKDIKNLKDSSLNLSSILVDLQSRVETLEQVQHGLQSLYDGQGQKIQKILLDMENHTISIEEIRARLEILKDNLDQFALIQKDIQEKQKEFLIFFEEIQNKIRDVSMIGSDLNSLVVKEVEGITSEIKKQAEVILLNQENIQKLGAEIERIYSDRKKEQDRFAFKQYEKKSDVLKEARRLYWDKQFNNAKDRFSYLVEQNYQRAEANYFLGQIAYRQNRFEDAVFYYKESATLDDKAEYMPTLMLHTVKSFVKLNDSKNALKFAESLLILYPQSKEAKEAKKIQTQIKGENKGGK